MPALIRPSFSLSVHASLLFLLVFLHTDFVCFSLSILISSLVCFLLFSGFLYKKDQFEPPITAENWSLGSLLFGLIFLKYVLSAFSFFAKATENSRFCLWISRCDNQKRHKKIPWFRLVDRTMPVSKSTQRSSLFITDEALAPVT